ncbi:hypothetical protein C8R42DRAFT_235809 [Lentinula raphanica]|nr:hypothetical protein C8R42DRAFT_235809 [Lentinula raphanica]
MRLLPFSLCSLSVFLLSCHSISVVMAVPFPTPAGPKKVNIMKLWVEVLNLEEWRLQLGSKTLANPSNIDDNKWKFKWTEYSSKRGYGPNFVELGAFQVPSGSRFGKDDKNAVKDGIGTLRAGNLEALLEDLLVSLSPETTSTCHSDSTTQHDSPARLKLPPRVTFTVTRSESDPHNDAWAILLDSKKLNPMVFLKKYGRAPSNWIQALGTQGREFKEKFHAAQKAAAKKAEKEEAERLAKEAAEKAEKEASSSTTAGSMLSVAQMLN